MRIVLLMVSIALFVGCSSGPRLQLDPSRAEFPFGGSIRVDGGIGAEEWAQARRIPVDLPSGRRVEILLQRDRRNFQFAFVGLDDPAPGEVRPEVLLDLWGNGSSTWDRNDWWIRIGQEDCWARGGWGEGDCRRVQPGLEANNFPLVRGQAVEVRVEFRAIGFEETYDDEIGLAFRFVDENGLEVAQWPLRAEVDDPSTWAPISLNH